jgi:hypothetical protein
MTSQTVASSTTASTPLSEPNVLDKEKIDALKSNQSPLLFQTTDNRVVDQSPDASSVLTFFVGVDTVFYIWTILLVSIVTYLSIYKYYQFLREQKQRKRTQNTSQMSPYLNLAINCLYKTLNVIFVMLGMLMTFLLNLITNNLNSPNQTVNNQMVESQTRSSNPAVSQSNSFNEPRHKNDSKEVNLFLWDSFLKWLYLNAESRRDVNNSLLTLLNNSIKSQNTVSSNSSTLIFRFFYLFVF